MGPEDLTSREDCKAASGPRSRILLLLPTTTYRADDFVSAAERLGVELAFGSDRCHVLADLGAAPPARDSLVLDFRDPEAAAVEICAYAKEKPIGAVLAADDQTTAIAARAASLLGLPHNDPDGVFAARDKLAMRMRLAKSRVKQPRFHVFARALDPVHAAMRIERSLGFPCVLKPRMLSASRGVIRADDVASCADAFARVVRLLRDPEVNAKGGRAAQSVLAESFVPGFEVALEGLLEDGELRVLALFDKPDPLDGPFFEETLYVTPSRLAPDVVEDIVATAHAAAAALGLREGPLHAELRVNDEGAWLVELAPRTIGGLCSRTLRFGLDMSLEEVVIRRALGWTLPDKFEPKGARASGVMMLPIPRTGTLREVGGVGEAEKIPLIEDVVITAKVGREIIALPEGSAYLGFIFARGESPEAVERALRDAHAKLEIEISPKIPVV